MYKMSFLSTLIGLPFPWHADLQLVTRQIVSDNIIKTIVNACITVSINLILNVFTLPVVCAALKKRMECQ
jgi:hypothetical protein